jgi:hypothetical protein
MARSPCRPSGPALESRFGSSTKLKSPVQMRVQEPSEVAFAAVVARTLPISWLPLLLPLWSLEVHTRCRSGGGVHANGAHTA